MLGTWGEILFIAIMALILIGPKELPAVLRTIGRIRQKIFHFQESFRSSIDPYIHGGEIDEYDQRARKNAGAPEGPTSFMGYGDETPEQGAEKSVKKRKIPHENS